MDTFPGLEIASHGWNHEYFSTFSLADQTTLLSESKAKIESLYPSAAPLATFIPPFNVIFCENNMKKYLF